MSVISEFWNPRQALLKQCINKPEKTAEARSLLAELHSQVHSGEIYGEKTYFDEIMDEVDNSNFAVMPSAKDVTIAWNIWHSTRIEDITMNILVLDEKQVLNAQWQEKLNTSVTDTGNAMTYDEILKFSKGLNLNALIDYRNAVGIKTKQVIESINAADMKRKFNQNQLERLTDEGCIINHPDSIWLKEFWSRKTVSGIFLMPITRHQIVHLNDCTNIIKKCR